MRGDISGWLDDRDWDKMDLLNKRRERPVLRQHKPRLIELELECYLDGYEKITWFATYNPILLRCTEERVVYHNEEIFNIKEKKYGFGGVPQDEIIFTYEGSALSQFDAKVLQSYDAIASLRKFIQGIHSFDMLSPRHLKRRAREGKNIGMSGERLSAFLSGLSSEQHTHLRDLIETFYPQIYTFGISILRSGWKALKILEENGPWLDAKHTNDGTLRVLAILAELYTEDTVVLFDEIENGLNPAIMKKLVEALSGETHQVVVTTHNPVFLNYLPEDKVLESVILVHRNKDGYTQATRYFELPSVAERLPFLSPGEVFLDVDIEQALHELQDTAEA